MESLERQADRPNERFRLRGFDAGGVLLAQLPKLQNDPQSLVAVDPASGAATLVRTLKDEFTDLSGTRLLSIRPNQPGPYRMTPRHPYDEEPRFVDATFEMRDARSGLSLWSRSFKDRAPRVWMPDEPLPIVSSSEASEPEALAEIKKDAVLRKIRDRFADLGGFLFVEVVDRQIGEVRRRLLVDIGVVRAVRGVSAAGNSLLVTDMWNRTAVFSLDSGVKTGYVFGQVRAIEPGGAAMVVVNGGSWAEVYALPGLERVRTYEVPSSLQFAKLGPVAQSVLLVTGAQEVIVARVPER